MQSEKSIIEGLWLVVGGEAILFAIFGLIIYILTIKTDQTLLSKLSRMSNPSQEAECGLIRFYTRHTLGYDILFWSLIVASFTCVLSYFYLRIDIGGFLITVVFLVSFLWQLKDEKRTAKGRAFHYQRTNETNGILLLETEEDSDMTGA